MRSTEDGTKTPPEAEQNGCRQRLEGYLSCHRRFPLAVACPQRKGCLMKKTLPHRIVRLEGELWRIRPDEGELDADEQQELREYLDEVRLPYRMEHGLLCIPGSITWKALSERLEHFYDGRAEVYPF